jgi:hypothetical protein
MKAEKFPVTITEKGVSAIIRESTKIKDGKKHRYFIVEYILRGKRKQVWRSDLAEAKAVASEACIKVANGDQASLEVKDTDRMAFTRGVEFLAPTGIPIDIACRDFADSQAILGGRVSIIEACRDWVKRNAVSLPKIAVADAVAEVQQRAVSDRKSKARQHELDVLLNQFAENFQCEAHSITPSLISGYLMNLILSERSKRNHQDAIKHLNRWLVLHGYLPKGTDWMAAMLSGPIARSNISGRTGRRWLRIWHMISRPTNSSKRHSEIPAMKTQPRPYTWTGKITSAS